MGPGLLAGALATLEVLAGVLAIVEPETVIRWHREGFRRCWRRKSLRGRVGRPGLDPEIVTLIRRMAHANVTWGAPRIRSALAMVGIEVAVSSVAKYMPRRHRPPSSTWRAFLENHLKDLLWPVHRAGAAESDRAHLDVAVHAWPDVRRSSCEGFVGGAGLVRLVRCGEAGRMKGGRASVHPSHPTHQPTLTAATTR